MYTTPLYCTIALHTHIQLYSVDQSQEPVAQPHRHVRHHLLGVEPRGGRIALFELQYRKAQVRQLQGSLTQETIPLVLFLHCTRGDMQTPRVLFESTRLRQCGWYRSRRVLFESTRLRRRGWYRSRPPALPPGDLRAEHAPPRWGGGGGASSTQKLESIESTTRLQDLIVKKG